MTLLALHGVSKSYGALKVIDDITLSVSEGE
ncbi:MAG: ABC transporter ATP-binding protein, partial [Variovorax sp.]|nr:ABC transporter ATP-binding protein [Variovorax sp.]